MPNKATKSSPRRIRPQPTTAQEQAAHAVADIRESVQMLLADFALRRAEDAHADAANRRSALASIQEHVEALRADVLELIRQISSDRTNKAHTLRDDLAQNTEQIADWVAQLRSACQDVASDRAHAQQDSAASAARDRAHDAQTRRKQTADLLASFRSTHDATVPSTHPAAAFTSRFSSSVAPFSATDPSGSERTSPASTSPLSTARSAMASIGKASRKPRRR